MDIFSQTIVNKELLKKYFVVKKAKLGSFVLTCDSNLVSCIRNICLQIVILKTLTCKAELSEWASRDLKQPEKG